MNRDEERVDAGRAYLPGGQGPISSTICGRDKCGRMAELGHDFCGPCLAWLLGDELDDPAPVVQPPSRGPTECKPPPGVDADEWYAALDVAIATCAASGSPPGNGGTSG